MADQGRLIKYTVGHYRQKGVSHEDFLKWLTHEHLPAAIPIFKRHGIKKYTLVGAGEIYRSIIPTRILTFLFKFVTPIELGAALQEELSKFRPNWQVGDFDCVLEYWMYDINALTSMNADPDWAGKAVKDEEKWCDLSKSTIYIGYDTPYLLETGEAVNLPE